MTFVMVRSSVGRIAVHELRPLRSRELIALAGRNGHVDHVSFQRAEHMEAGGVTYGGPTPGEVAVPRRVLCGRGRDDLDLIHGNSRQPGPDHPGGVPTR